jgi:hypothetical protein
MDLTQGPVDTLARDSKLEQQYSVPLRRIAATRALLATEVARKAEQLPGFGNMRIPFRRAEAGIEVRQRVEMPFTFSIGR